MAEHAHAVDHGNDAHAGADSGQYLTFTLAGETYGVDILSIKEIIEYGNLTSVPMVPEFIAGVINLRGSVVPVVNLARRFGGEATRLTKRTSIVIVELNDDQGSTEIGMMVDTVKEVREVGRGDIEAAPTFGTRIRSDFIAGMARVGGQFLVLLDMGRVLSLDELSLLESVRAAGPATAVAES